MNDDFNCRIKLSEIGYHIDRVSKELDNGNEDIVVKDNGEDPAERFGRFIMEKVNYPYFSTLYDRDMWLEDKRWLQDFLGCEVGQLEDFEEYFGIELITLLKALKNGIYITIKVLEFGKFKKIIRYIAPDALAFRTDIKPYQFDFCDILLCHESGRYTLDRYGKTWALTKEELE